MKEKDNQIEDDNWHKFYKQEEGKAIRGITAVRTTVSKESITDEPNFLIHSLQTNPFLSIGPHMYSFSSEILSGSVMNPGLSDMLWPLLSKYWHLLTKVSFPSSEGHIIIL